MKKINQNGMTLVELIIMMLTLIIIITILYWLLVTGNVMWKTSSTRSEVIQELHFIANFLEIRLRDSNINTVTDNTELQPKAFSFLSAYDTHNNFVTDAEGKPIWQKYEIYYIPTNTNNLLKKEVYGSFTGPLSPQGLTSYCDGQGKVIISCIRDIGLTLNYTNNSLLIFITNGKTNPSGEIEEQAIEMTVFMRN